MTSAGGPVLEASGLFHIYRDGDIRTVALRGADISLHPGVWTAVVGPSGSGKSTLLHALAGVVEPSAGSISIEGTDVTRLTRAEQVRWRRRRVGVVLQRDNLHPLLDVADNVALPLRLDGRAPDEIRDRVNEVLRRVGLADHRDDRVSQLSGGERQRVALAIALAAHPSVLLADEPTGELDEETASEILDLIDEAVREMHAAVLTVTHGRAVADRAQRALTMRDGVLHDR